MEYLNELNEEQRVAVEHIDGAALVVASAGSGKTRVLTYRIAHLIANGIPPYKILSLTFTNKAAREMKERIAKIVGEELASGLWMGTFHSVFARILRYEAEAIGFNSSFTIYDSSDARNAIKMIVKAMELDDTVYKPTLIANRISAAKNNLVTSAAYAASTHLKMRDDAAKRPHTSEIYQQYTKKCKKANAMDFDDLLLYTNILFKNHPTILEKYQERFSHILVDEYQDTNMAQYMIVKKLGERHRNVFMVGDDAQSIYSFRGAKIENILNFQKDYKEAKLFKLERNYRSTKNIVEVANSVIAHNKEQLKKSAYSMQGEGSKVKIIKALTDNEEGFLVAKELFTQFHYGGEAYSDFAILYRTNAQSRIFEEALRKRNIPYKIYGGLSFYQRKEIKDMLSYLRLVSNPNDEEALRRIINYPKRGIGNTTLDKIMEIGAGMGVSMWEVIEKIEAYSTSFNGGTMKKLADFRELILTHRQEMEVQSAYEMSKSIAISSGMLQDLKSDKSLEGISRLDNLNELLNGVQDFAESAEEEGNVNTIASYLENVALLTDLDREEDEGKTVSMMTVHAAKGLEFNNVFVVGMEEKLFPSNFGEEVSPKSIEEERRLFYVALTRAKKNAYISYAITRYRWGKVQQEPPSRFLFEMDERYLDGTIQKEVYISESQEKQLDGKTWFTGKSKTVLPKSMPDYGKKNLSGRFKKVSQVQTNDGFVPDDASVFEENMQVIHSRFGLGTIVELKGEGQNKKATVRFNSFGEKTLLLKFAKLKIV